MNTNERWWWCETCNAHWEGEGKCPCCGEEVEVRKTMPKKLAEECGLA